MSDRRAVYQLRRLITWLEAFKRCFGHRAQVLALRRYVQGLLSDSARKSMEAMLARVTEPGSYQAFQHFITNAPWDTECVWRQLRAVLPEREGLMIFDGTSFPKQGKHSVGVARQYCGALGKIANCQVAVTAALWTEARAYLLGAALYLPEEWVTDTARTQAHVPVTIRFQEKWRQALTLLRQVRASGFIVTGVLADAEFGDIALFRAMLHRLRLPYAVGISSQVTVFRGTPRLEWPPRPRHGRPRQHPQLARGIQPLSVTALAAAMTQWQRISWRNRRGGRRWTVQCTASRVTPAHDWRSRRLAREVWLLCERDLGETPRTKFFFVNLPPTTALKDLVRFAHQRWAIEQQYQELKTELGLDHFEGRTFPGWHHHVVLTAIAYNFLQAERRRMPVGLTFPAVRGIVQEIFTAYLFAQRPQYLKRIDALRSVQLRI
ncbi:MAG TPA: IS701 family transposase [Longimicrobiales bacterium]|nr:IS701 family transposase [Longimicrobiales bacterium]